MLLYEKLLIEDIDKLINDMLSFEKHCHWPNKQIPEWVQELAEKYNCDSGSSHITHVVCSFSRQ